jgi:CPA2 family monovalent cation:H+ antiporter-2
VDDLALVLDLVLAVGAAFAGGALAQRIGQPPILGYLLGGVAIGPFTPGPVADLHHVQVFAEIGVAFLMFALGAEVSIAELRRLGRLGGLGGVLQIGATMALGPMLAPVLGLGLTQGVFLGALLALSSTVVALKVLMARGELQALHGRVALGILIVQDLAVVPMVVVLPALAVGGANLFAELGFAALKAGGVLFGAYLVGGRLVPWALARAAVSRSRELFLLGIVALTLGTALATFALGLSLAFGAFLAGLAVAETEYRHQVVAEVLPLRDLFASLFFVSVGMLINPAALITNAGPVALLTGVAIVGKVVVVVGALLLLGLPGRAALLTGASLAQIGEFSFVLARIGVDAQAIPTELFDLILVAAVLSIVATPFALRAAPALGRAARRLPLIGDRFAEPIVGDDAVEGMRRHTVICGYGRVARELASALEARRFPYVVLEYNPLIARDLRDRGVPVVYGDATNPAVLEHGHVERARLLAVLVPDAVTAELVTRQARALNRDLDIVARAASAEGVGRLRAAGATAVVQPEFEGGVEVIHHALQRYGVVGPELAHVTAGRRAAFYRSQADT